MFKHALKRNKRSRRKRIKFIRSSCQLTKKLRATTCMGILELAATLPPKPVSLTSMRNVLRLTVYEILSVCLKVRACALEVEAWWDTLRQRKRYWLWMGHCLASIRYSVLRVSSGTATVTSSCVFITSCLTCYVRTNNYRSLKSNSKLSLLRATRELKTRLLSCKERLIKEVLQVMIQVMR